MRTTRPLSTGRPGLSLECRTVRSVPGLRPALPRLLDLAPGGRTAVRVRPGRSACPPLPSTSRGRKPRSPRTLRRGRPGNYRREATPCQPSFDLRKRSVNPRQRHDRRCRNRSTFEPESSIRLGRLTRLCTGWARSPILSPAPGWFEWRWRRGQVCAAGTTTVPSAVVTTRGGSHTFAVLAPCSGVARQTTCAVKRIRRDRRPTAVSSAVTSRTSPP